jgi:hypothetical protein
MTMTALTLLLSPTTLLDTLAAVLLSQVGGSTAGGFANPVGGRTFGPPGRNPAAPAYEPARDVGGLWQGGTPFIDPMNIHDSWWLTLLPLALLVSVAYKAVRMRSLERYWLGVLIMTMQIVLALIAFAAGLHVLLELVIPFLRG